MLILASEPLPIPASIRFAMKNALMSAAVLSSLVCAPAALAGDQAGDGAERSEVRPARLIAFDGAREFLKTSTRLRVWRGEVGYTLAVDAAGTPTECELTERFRMNYVNDKLCEVLLKHHTFEPALDASGAPVEGSYEGLINYQELRDKE
jgi:hypothetical protein